MVEDQNQIKGSLGIIFQSVSRKFERNQGKEENQTSFYNKQLFHVGMNDKIVFVRGRQSNWPKDINGSFPLIGDHNTEKSDIFLFNKCI